MSALTPATLARLAELMRDYPNGAAALISALFLVQAEQSYLTEESLSELAAFLDMPKSQVYETATFYSLFEFGPQGRHVIRMCRSICCYLRESDALLAHVQRRLSIGPEETTADGRFTLKMSECLALCNRAPSMMIDDRTFGPLTPQEFDRILEEFP